MFTGLLQPSHLLVLLVVVLVVFGPKRLPELGRSLGRGFRELKESLEGHHEEIAEPTEPATAETDQHPAAEPAEPATAETGQHPAAEPAKSATGSHSAT